MRAQCADEYDPEFDPEFDPDHAPRMTKRSTLKAAHFLRAALFRFRFPVPFRFARSP
jgi:hypothetical protein